jgi:hypothetical protein
VKVCVKVSLVTQTFTTVYEAAEEGGYAAFVEEVPGAVSQGETLEDDSLRASIRADRCQPLRHQRRRNIEVVTNPP